MSGPSNTAPHLNIVRDVLQCPKCGATYDASYTTCLADGTALVAPEAASRGPVGRVLGAIFVFTLLGAAASIGLWLTRAEAPEEAAPPSLGEVHGTTPAPVGEPSAPEWVPEPVVAPGSHDAPPSPEPPTPASPPVDPVPAPAPPVPAPAEPVPVPEPPPMDVQKSDLKNPFGEPGSKRQP